MKNRKLFIILFVHFSYYVQSQALHYYSCIKDRIDISGMEDKRTFDKNGILLSQDRYHPLSIAQYGVLAYYYFEETQDSVYYRKCVNQAKYFKDTSKVNILFDGKGIGLPYNFDFWDLKAPWYSGMTQGYALSYLLRYYNLTKDQEVIPIIKKVAYVLLQKQEIGGTISTTKEGYTWIEEYPNSKRSPQVLNGYINGLIGLKEYSDYFPEDNLAQKILKETYRGVVNSLEHFDTSKWSYYNRANKRLSNKYLRYQIYEMRHLFQLFNDDIFDKQMRIWSVLSLNKYIKSNSKAYKFPNHDISLPIKKIGEKKYGIPITDDLLAIKTDRINISSHKSITDAKKVFSNNVLTSSIIEKKGKQFYSFFIDDTVAIDYIEIKGKGIKSKNINVFVENGLRKLRQDEIIVETNTDRTSILLQKNDINEIIIQIKNNDFNPKFKFYNTTLQKAPFFGHVKTKVFDLNKEDQYEVVLPKYNTKEAVVFYRLLSDKTNLNSGKWKAKNTVLEKFDPKSTGVYQFMIVFDYESPLSAIGEFSVTKIKKEKSWWHKFMNWLRINY